MGGMGGDFSACNRTLQECHSSHYPAQCNKHILTVLGFSIKKYLQCVLGRNNGGNVRAEKLVSWPHCLYLPVSARYKLATAKGGRGHFEGRRRRRRGLGDDDSIGEVEGYTWILSH